MKKNTLSTLASALLIAGFATNLAADSVVATYSCELEDGKKQEDVQILNGRWLKWVRANVSEDITSSVGTAIVGDQEIFLFVDTYPDLNTWAAAQTALDGEAASELEDLFEDTAECSENRLWKFEPTE
jgi:hypothetical protein